MEMVRRYNTEFRVWEVGYWVNNTLFHVVDLVYDYDELSLYREAA
jgi:hypothetical protein